MMAPNGINGRADHRVDLFLTCYEDTYRRVLSSGFAASVSRQNSFEFSRIVVVINNVLDRTHAELLAEARIRAGEIDEWHFTSSHIERAYRSLGLSRRRLGRIHYYSDHLLVAAYLPGNKYMLHWDADIKLVKPADWIRPAIDYLEQNRNCFVVNPHSETNKALARETLRSEGPFVIGYGFSDQIFLVRKAEISRQIYNRFALPSLRYPLAHVARIFEARVDSYMRTERRYRATYRPAVYHHRDENTTTGSVSLRLRERVKQRVNAATLSTILRLPIKPETWVF